MLEDRPAKIAGQRRPEPRHVAIAAGHIGEGVGRMALRRRSSTRPVAALRKLGGSSASQDTVTSDAATAPVMPTISPRRKRTAGRGRPRSTSVSGSSFGGAAGASARAGVAHDASPPRAGAPIVADDPDDLLMLARRAGARRRRTAGRRHKNGRARGSSRARRCRRRADDEQRRRLALAEVGGKLDEHLPAVVERAERPPGRPVAVDPIVEVRAPRRRPPAATHRLRRAASTPQARSAHPRG